MSALGLSILKYKNKKQRREEKKTQSYSHTVRYPFTLICFLWNWRFSRVRLDRKFQYTQLKRIAYTIDNTCQLPQFHFAWFYAFVRYYSAHFPKLLKYFFLYCLEFIYSEFTFIMAACCDIFQCLHCILLESILYVMLIVHCSMLIRTKSNYCFSLSPLTTWIKFYCGSLWNA